MELEEKSHSTIQKYRHDVVCFMTFLNGRQLFTKKDVIAYKEWLLSRYAVRSANSMLAALNHFFQLQEMGQCCVKAFKIQRATFCDQYSELSVAEYRRLLLTALRKKNVRLYYVMQTLCSTGIRVSELKYVTIKAIKNGVAVARNKGKTRVILLPVELCKDVQVYAAQCGIRDGSVFVTGSGRPMDRSNIWNSVKRLCKKANVDPRKVYPHNLRHLFARTFYQKEKDITHLADILGHQNVNTTRGYIILSGEEHRKQIDNLHLYRPREILEREEEN